MLLNQNNLIWITNQGQALADFILKFSRKDFDGQKALVIVEPDNEEHSNMEKIPDFGWT